MDLWWETHLVAPPELLLGVPQLGLPEHCIQVRQGDLRPVLLYLAVVKTNRCPSTARAVISKALSPKPNLPIQVSMLLRCPKRTKFLEALYAQPD